MVKVETLLREILPLPDHHWLELPTVKALVAVLQSQQDAIEILADRLGDTGPVPPACATCHMLACVCHLLPDETGGEGGT